MDEVLSYLIFFVVLAAVLGCFVAFAQRMRRRGVAGSAVRAVLLANAEGLHGTLHDAGVEIQAQAQRKVPMRSPDDPWTPGRDEAKWRGAGGRPPRGSRRRRLRGPWRRRG
ncbi:hypothetical protein [Streptomyces sp. SID3343]|uniref:hypothetical protein n=1 Tax=Streptomyces sp. SID3343 TaxID=2690260 RepID=UPI00136C19D2|nr:hypothetical protein [Streptomyces sp. SID3343]MYW00165.1 hypothetical protein [Streptomyces sp. SID3343]